MSVLCGGQKLTATSSLTLTWMIESNEKVKKAQQITIKKQHCIITKIFTNFFGPLRLNATNNAK